jgi:hypothetical protein
MPNRQISFGLLLFVAFLSRASGQTALQRFDRQLEEIQRQTMLEVNRSVPAERRAVFDYGGYLTASYWSVDDLNHDNHGLWEYDLVGYARLNIDDIHEFFARGRVSFLNYNPGDSFDGEGSDTPADVELAYYRFDLKRALAAYSGIKTDYDLSLIGGRQFVYWGNALVLGRYIDGVRLDATNGTLSLQAIAGVTPQRTVDFDSSRPNFDDHTLRGFFGPMLSATIESHHPFVYALIQRDFNHGDTTVTPFSPRPIVTRFNYDSYYIGAGSTGSLSDHLLYGAEIVFEGGKSLSNSFQTTGGTITPAMQTTDHIEAYAADARVDYLINDPNRTRLSAEVTFATGDSDRLNSSSTFGGNKPHSVDRAFNAFGAINTGLAFAPQVSNLIAIRTGISSYPFAQNRVLKNLQFGGDLFVFLKGDTSAPIDEPTGEGRVLGTEPDLFINWQIRSDVTLALRWGMFVPGNTIANDATRQFFYAGLTFAF